MKGELSVPLRIAVVGGILDDTTSPLFFLLYG